MRTTGRRREDTLVTLRNSAGDRRLRLATLASTANVSAASNAALKLATGEYVALLDHDDELAPEALAEVVRYLNAHPDADVIYSDEDKLDESGAHCDPYFKPDWSPELFLSYMYTCHLMVVRRPLVEEVGGFRVGLRGRAGLRPAVAPHGTDRPDRSHSEGACTTGERPPRPRRRLVRSSHGRSRRANGRWTTTRAGRDRLPRSRTVHTLAFTGFAER